MKWTEETAKAMVTRNKGTITGKQISCKAGLRILGAIDYLVGKHGYRRA